MTVKELIRILKTTKDNDLSEITFYIGEKTYDIKSIGQFGIITDVNIELKEIESPLISLMGNVRRDKQKMVADTLKKINKDLKTKKK